MVSEYARYQTQQLQDPRNQKALDAGIQALAVFNGTGRLINREVVPRAMEVLDNLSNATASLDRAIQATDRSVNGISPGGRKTFGVMYRHAGRVRRMTFSTFPPLKLAEDRKADAFKDLAADYMQRYSKPKKKSWKEDERIINNKLNPAIGNITAKQVTRSQIRGVLENIVGTAPIEANRTLATVRKIYHWALSQDLVQNNPCLGISAPGMERQRDRVLSEEEIKKAWNEFAKEAPPMAATFKLRLRRAQRGGEVFSIEWKELDLENGWWTIPAEKAKNGLTHWVPLSPLAIKISNEIRARQLQSKTRNRSAWVFPAHCGEGHLTTAQKAVERIRDRAGIKDFTAHDLRRTAASMMTSMGIPRLTVSKILNHV